MALTPAFWLVDKSVLARVYVPAVAMPVRAEERARELERDLVLRGQHRGGSVN